MDFETYQEIAATTAVYKDKVVYPTIGLAGEVGEVSEKVKKVLRDSGGVFSEEKKIEIAKELGDVLWYVSAIATDLDLYLVDIAQTNIDKLLSRKERGVISGSGDNR
jgi:NTP pyrophosphatase (non-canonical NTP hydrolase)